jgi:hypothetical protein
MTTAAQFQSLLRQFEEADQAARQANLQRYQEISEGYGTLADLFGQRAERITGMTEGLGGVQRELQDRQFGQERGALTQNMISRGLYGTTAPGMYGNQLSVQQAQARSGLEQGITGQQMDIRGQVTGDHAQSQLAGLQFREGRQDIGPSYGQVFSTAQHAGQAIGAGPATRYNV